MHPQQQTSGQIQGSQYLNFGTFNITATGLEIAAGDVGYLDGCGTVNGFNPGTSTQISFILTNPVLDPIYINDGNVSAAIKDRAGDTIVSGKTLDYVAGSDGLYRETFAAYSLNVGELYNIEYTSTDSTGLSLKCYQKLRFNNKRCC